MSDIIWHLANVVYLFHIFVIVPLLIFAIPLVGTRLGGAFVFTTASLQAAFVGCPLTDLEMHLRKLARPSEQFTNSGFTREIYQNLMGPFSFVHWLVSALLAAVAVYCFFKLQDGGLLAYVNEKRKRKVTT